MRTSLSRDCRFDQSEVPDAIEPAELERPMVRFERIAERDAVMARRAGVTSRQAALERGRSEPHSARWCAPIGVS